MMMSNFPELGNDRFHASLHGVADDDRDARIGIVQCRASFQNVDSHDGPRVFKVVSPDFERAAVLNADFQNADGPMPELSEKSVVDRKIA